MADDSASYNIIIRADATGVGAGANQAVSMLNRIGTSIKALPVGTFQRLGATLLTYFSFRFLASQIRQLIDYGDAMENLARRTNISADVLQAWDVAARMSGGSIYDLTTAIRRLQIAQDSAIAGQKRYQQAFRAFGISPEELWGTQIRPEQSRGTQIRPEESRGTQMRPEQLLERLLARMAAPERPGMQHARLLFGFSADRLLMLARNNFTDAANHARQFGLIIDGVTRARMKALNDQLTILSKQLQLSLLPVVQALMPVLARLVAVLVASIETIKTVIESFKRAPTQTIADIIGSSLRNNPFFRLGRGVSQTLVDIINRESGAGIRDVIGDMIETLRRSPGRGVVEMVSGRATTRLSAQIAKMLQEEVNRGEIDIESAKRVAAGAFNTLKSVFGRMTDWAETYSEELYDVLEGKPVQYGSVFRDTFKMLMDWFKTAKPYEPVKLEQPEVVATQFKPPQIQIDQLAKIGGYRGGPDMTMRIETQQLDQLRKINLNTSRLVREFDEE